MNTAPARTFVSLALPGGALLLAALVLLRIPGLPLLAPPVVAFFSWAVLIGALVLACRFKSSRALFGVLALWIADRALLMLAHASPAAANTGFGLVALLLPANLVFFSVIGECGLTLASIGSGLGILSLQTIAVAVLARPENVEFAAWIQHAYLDRGLFAWTPIPQLALLSFLAALAWLGMRLSILRKPLDGAYFWAACTTFAAMNAAAPGRSSSFYFAVGMLVFAAAQVETLYLLAYHDELTGLPGRRAFVQATLSLAPPYAIAMVDVDHFKRFNDTYGHDTGDQVLRLVASRLARVGGGGKAYRYGGEEFAIVFFGKTAEDSAPHLEELRAQVATTAFTVRGPDRSDRRRQERRYAAPGRRPIGKQRSRASVTVSIGLADDAHRATPELVTAAADQALYRAKDQGRNRVEIFTPAPRRAAKAVASRA